MNKNVRFSEQGIPQWFSPQHAGEKFKDLCLELTKLAMDVEKKKQQGLAKKLWALQEFAEEYATLYAADCPIQSVRIMQPSGAIFVILADDREVLVPQPERVADGNEQ